MLSASTTAATYAVTYRAATVADCPLILEFITELAAYEQLSNAVTTDAMQLQTSLFGVAPRAECWLAFRGDEPLGFALFCHNFSTFLGKAGLYIEDVFVRDTARGLGVGTGFFQRIAQIAQERGCRRIDWQCLNWNKPALKFYQSIGATQRADWLSLRLEAPAIAALAAQGDAAQAA
jgi:GNAT superfamily N-acetyltransferase